MEELSHAVEKAPIVVADDVDARARRAADAKAFRTDPGLDNPTIAQRRGISRATVENIQRRYRKGGLERALHEAPRSGQPKKITQREEAYITAIACSEPPAGQARWTMQMMADRLVELRYLDALSAESVRLVLKKTCSSPGRKSAGALVS
jgi:transposase